MPQKDKKLNPLKIDLFHINFNIKLDIQFQTGEKNSIVNDRNGERALPLPINPSECRNPEFMGLFVKFDCLTSILVLISRAAG